MRNSPLKGLMKSPLKQEYINNNKAKVNDGIYSPDKLKGNVGDKLVKGFMTAVAPTNVAELIPGVKHFKRLSKVYKATKAAINLSGGKGKS